MNIKSLLIGSAAALTAVTGARAADAVMAPEPEPVEYVRVCDAYGAGFFYIPGTETCLQISGRVRYQIDASDTSNGWIKTVNMRVQLDARSETDWGTLRSYIRLQAGWTPVGLYNDGPVSVDQAVIQLGGLFMGYTESAFTALWGGGLGSFGLLHTDGGGSYAYQQRAQIGYRFSGGNGFYGALVLEDDNLSGGGYMPDVVGVVGVTQGWGGVFAHVGYDESASAFGVKAGVHVNIPNMPGSSFRFGGLYADAPNTYAAQQPISGAYVNWSLAASYNQAFSSTLSATVGYQYLRDFTSVPNGHMLQAAVVWTPVTNFEVRLEGQYAREQFVGGYQDATKGFLRFTRYF
jgi:hypothetical protein